MSKLGWNAAALSPRAGLPFYRTAFAQRVSRRARPAEGLTSRGAHVDASCRCVFFVVCNCCATQPQHFLETRFFQVFFQRTFFDTFRTPTSFRYALRLDTFQFQRNSLPPPTSRLCVTHSKSVLERTSFRPKPLPNALARFLHISICLQVSPSTYRTRTVYGSTAVILILKVTVAEVFLAPFRRTCSTHIHLNLCVMLKDQKTIKTEKVP